MENILSTIKEPSILKNFNFNTLLKLADELREVIIKTVHKNGGHLASNLGTVELSIALHYVFDSPVDKIIWDVGHQAYSHKLLTGRYEKFDTLRQYNGISGFPNPKESEHDLFIAGHSSTSIALASGLAQARDLKGEKNKVIAVIGDGALTSGLAYEAINNVGHRKNDLIIILNDNDMSISKNVGMISDYLSKIMTTPIYHRLRGDMENIFKKFAPKFGNKASEIMNRLEESIKILLLPQVVFEDLGLKYFGIVDGHNLKEMIKILNKVKKMDYPVLLHVKTVKGKGYKKAEEKPTEYHGLAPQLIEKNGVENASESLTFTQVFGDEIVKIASENDNVIAITGAMTDGTGLTEFSNKFPNRFFDVGIAEEYAVTFAAGLAKEGFKPYVAIYSTFLQRAYDQIIHDMTLQNLPIILAVDRAGLVGEDGPTHHGTFDLSYLSHIPNIVIMIPKDEFELRQMLRLAGKIDQSAAIRYPRRKTVKLLDKLTPVELGEPEIIIDENENKVLLIAVGSMVNESIKANELLKSKNINCNIVNLRFIKPLNFKKIISLVQKAEFIFTIEENSIIGGAGAYLNILFLNNNILGKKIINIGVPDEFIPAGSISILLEKLKLDAKGIAERIERVWNVKS